jgi:AcrR family transcriptional regulator
LTPLLNDVKLTTLSNGVELKSMPPKFKSEAEKLVIRTQILDAARELFVAKGVDAVTMREIAKKIAYSPTTIYLHFKDKDALMQELCLTDCKKLGVALNAILQIEEPVSRMMAMASVYAQFALAYPNHYRMMFMTTRPQYTLDEADIEPSLSGYNLLNAVVADVFSLGHFRPEFQQPALVAQTIWAGIHGVCSLEITMGHDPYIAWSEITARIDFMRKTLMRGLLKEGVLYEG